MFGKKLPLKQPPPQVYEQEYSQEQSEPLIEEVDSTYEPTQKQVRQYAIETLGMKLPEDQNLLYLAREGLKAPIAANWVPYQSRNGEIYYKHNITQQKTYDHPTDTQYRKKYQQFKEKAARKNLKSISLKQNLNMQGLLPNNNSLATGLGLINNSLGLSNNSNLSNQQQLPQITIDEEVIQQYQRDLQEFQKKMEKDWKKYQEQADEQHEKRMKKIKDDNQQERNQLQGKSTKKTSTNRLQQQQKKIQQNLEQSQRASLDQQMRLLQKEQENKLSEYRVVYQQDNAIKLRKLQHQLQQSYHQKAKALEEKLKRAEQKRIKQKQSRVKKLQQTRQQYQKPNNPEIAVLLKSTLQQNLTKIKQQYNKKLIQKQDELAHQLQQMRKILGIDKSQNLLLMANKKQKLINLSQMKIAAKKNKEIQSIQAEYSKDVENQICRLKQKLSKQHMDRVQQKKKQLQSEFQMKKLKIQSQFTQKSKRQIEQLYQNSASQRNQYQNTMNKKMSQLRMQYIDQIQNGNKGKDKQDVVITRVLIQEKENQVVNKEQLVKNLEKQIQMERQQWKIMLFQQQLGKILAHSNSDDNSELTSYLKSKLSQMNIPYRSAELSRISQKYVSLQKKYKQDKKLLTRILRGIQQTAAYNINQMRKNSQYGDGLSSGSGMLIKKYNQDVRNMRDNQEILGKFQVLIKKVEMGGKDYQSNLNKLKNFVQNQLQYKDIVLKGQIAGMDQNPCPQNYQRQGNRKLQQLSIPASQSQPHSDPQSNKPWYAASSSSNSTPISVQQALRQHSQFLSNVKNQLNRKLYQIRYTSKY